MKILIINQPPFNRGDESAHKGLIRALLKEIPDANINVMSDSSNRESVRQYEVNDSRVKYIFDPYQLFFHRFKRLGCINRIWRLIWYIHPTMLRYRKIYSWADYVVCAPGGICMGGFQDWEHLFRLRLAKFFNKPLAYYGRSFGPFLVETELNKQFKKVSLEMLNYFCFLSIRDRKTELLAQELKVPYVSTIDSAFLDAPQVEIPYEIKSAIDNNPYMVFVPNYLLWHYAYKDKISHDTVINFYIKVIDEIQTANPELNIVMLPQLFGRYDYDLWDLALFRDLAKIKNDKRIIVVADCYSSDIQQTIIRDARYVIGARYHSIVFAINQGVPCIALSYEHKIAGLLESLGKQEWIVDFTNTLDTVENQASCLRQIRNLISELQSDQTVRDKAKRIANKCLLAFVDMMKR